MLKIVYPICCGMDAHKSVAFLADGAKIPQKKKGRHTRDAVAYQTETRLRTTEFS